MRRLVPIAFVAAALFPAIAQAETRTFDLPPFDRIDVSAGIRAEIVVGGDQSVRIDTDSGTFQDIEVAVRNGRLVLGLDRGFFNSLLELFSPGSDVVAYVSVPVLNEIDASSGALVEADAMSGEFLSLNSSSGAQISVSEITGDEVRVSSSSGASIDASGACGRLDADTSSGAHLELERLQCDAVGVDASSGASATVFAVVSIDLQASSGGSVDVAGKPGDITVNTSSGGSVAFD